MFQSTPPGHDGNGVIAKQTNTDIQGENRTSDINGPDDYNNLSQEDEMLFDNRGSPESSRLPLQTHQGATTMIISETNPLSSGGVLHKRPSHVTSLDTSNLL